MQRAADFAVILVAAGRGTRFGGDKLAIDVNGRSVFSRSLRPFLDRPDVACVVAVTDPAMREVLTASLAPEDQGSARLRWCDGGACRAQSVHAGLLVLEAEAREAQFVAIHDAARPAVSGELIDRVFAAAVKSGAAIPAVPATETIKRVRNGVVAETPPRSELVAVQTPQAMRRVWLIAAFARCPIPLEQITDDAQLLELAGYPVRVVDGDRSNLKITTPDDVERVRRSLR